MILTKNDIGKEYMIYPEKPNERSEATLMEFTAMWQDGSCFFSKGQISLIRKNGSDSIKPKPTKPKEDVLDVLWSRALKLLHGKDRNIIRLVDTSSTKQKIIEDIKKDHGDTPIDLVCSIIADEIAKIDADDLVYEAINKVLVPITTEDKKFLAANKCELKIKYKSPYFYQVDSMTLYFFKDSTESLSALYFYFMGEGKEFAPKGRETRGRVAIRGEFESKLAEYIYDVYEDYEIKGKTYLIKKQ